MRENSDSISLLKERCRALIRDDRLDQAKGIVSQICELKPSDVDAWRMLGSINTSLGNLDDAGDCFRKAISLQSGNSQAHLDLGNIYALQRRLDEAQACYREALRLDPHNALAYCNLGNILHAVGRTKEAIDCFQQGLCLNPNLAEPLVNLANIFYGQNRLNEAFECLAKAIDLLPDSILAHNNLGNVYMRQGKLDEAMSAYQKALSLDSGNTTTHCNIGNVLRTLRLHGDAETHFQRAIQLNPDHVDALIGLGNIAYDQARNGEALTWYRHALHLRPDMAIIHNNLASTLCRLGRIDEALMHYRESLRLDPKNAETHSNYLYVMTYHEAYDPARIFAEHVRWGEVHGRNSMEIAPHKNVPDADKRLRIGYVSGDFRNHPVGIFIEQVLAHHDKSGFEIICYSNHAKCDDLTERLRGYADHWRDVIAQPDDSLAQLIRQDGVDILVDLAGHTALNRLTVFALKPAPVQVTWMSYITTTGLKEIDYIIGNRIIIPPEDDRYYTERVVRLPHSFLCFMPPSVDIKVAALPALASGRITFGCFNNTAKVNPRVIAVWAKILLGLPGSRLTLKSMGFGDEAVKSRYKELFARHGIEPERVQFSGHSERDEYFAAYNEVDIGLDPFPYNGGTTTIEAVWMGVPVMTLRGNRFAGRMGENIMTNIGLEECMADSEEAYVADTIALASNLSHLAQLRAGLRERLLNSPLCDGPGFTRELEAAYRTMWQTWCRTRTHAH